MTSRQPFYATWWARCAVCHRVAHGAQVCVCKDRCAPDAQVLADVPGTGRCWVHGPCADKLASRGRGGG